MRPNDPIFFDHVTVNNSICFRP